MDRLDSIAAVVAIADKGSFSAAARSLGVSPQAVTRAVAGLEERLGARLFRRTTRSVRLTGDGSAFVERGRRILAEYRDAELFARGARAEPQGMLSVTAPVVFGRLHVLPIIADLLARHPRLRVRLVLVDRAIQLVEEGIDVAVRIGDLADSALHAVRVGDVRRVVVASPAYLASRGAPAAVADLREHDIVSFTGLTPTDEWRFGADGRTVVRVAPRLTVNGAEAAVDAAEGGLGIARVLSYQVAEAVAAGRLRTVLDEFAPQGVPVQLVFEARRGASPAVRRFVDLASERLRAALRP